MKDIYFCLKCLHKDKNSTVKLRDLHVIVNCGNE